MNREGTVLGSGARRAKEWWWAPGITTSVKPLLKLEDNSWSYCSRVLAHTGMGYSVGAQQRPDTTKNPSPWEMLRARTATGRSAGNLGQEPGTTRQTNKNNTID